MKKRYAAMLMAAAMTVGSAMTSFAGWQSDANGWWWQNEDGSYPSNTWQWIDGNGDGISESYYFGPDGYMYANATTPDGYQVNADGAWTVNGVVQTQTDQTPNNEAMGTYSGYINSDILNQLLETKKTYYGKMQDVFQTEDIQAIIDYYKSQGWKAYRIGTKSQISARDVYEYWLTPPMDVYTNETRYEIFLGGNGVSLAANYSIYFDAVEI